MKVFKRSLRKKRPELTNYEQIRNKAVYRTAQGTLDQSKNKYLKKKLFHICHELSQQVIREAFQKKIQNVGGVDPKVHIVGIEFLIDWK